ncbi:hypothetical protein [Streptomyces sp. NRRL B-1347]|uniref:hypothetical protein n=1 Tax=Streptomyces sp. NRRL B-1347 TaxID=1476877 RepID=UPI0004C753AB|nr:hypothetical protein [Streptomyces sp. NRRL B-1347]
MADEQQTTALGWMGDVEELTARIGAGGIQAQAPDWWPLTFDPATPRILRTVEEGLEGLL